MGIYSSIVLDFLLYKNNFTASERFVPFSVFVSRIPATNCSLGVVFLLWDIRFQVIGKQNQTRLAGLWLSGRRWRDWWRDGWREIRTASELGFFLRWSPSMDLSLQLLLPCIAGDFVLCYLCDFSGILYIFKMQLLG